MILEDDVQCCGTMARGAHSHPGAQLGELTGLFHLNAPFVINNHHFNHNPLPAGSPLVMPLSPVGAGDWGGEGCVGYLMDSFIRATFRSLHVHKMPQFGKSGWCLVRFSSYTQLQQHTFSLR